MNYGWIYTNALLGGILGAACAQGASECGPITLGVFLKFCLYGLIAIVLGMVGFFLEMVLLSWLFDRWKL